MCVPGTEVISGYLAQMEVEEEFVPNLAAMLEISLVEGAHTMLSEGETRSKNCEI